MPRLHTVVMVPKGAEFQAVQRGMEWAKSEFQDAEFGEIVSLPVGPVPVQRFLSQWIQSHPKISEQTSWVVLLGLCGSLSGDWGLGDRLAFGQCFDAQAGSDQSPLRFSNELFLLLNEQLGGSVTQVTGVMCDRVVARSQEKQKLHSDFAADAVDMESYVALDCLQPYIPQVVMLRVVSDDVHHDLPDLSAAFDADGNIKPWIMARQFLREPVGSVRLIRGSLAALKELEQLSYQIAIALKNLQRD